MFGEQTCADLETSHLRHERRPRAIHESDPYAGKIRYRTNTVQVAAEVCAYLAAELGLHEPIYG